MFKKKAEYHLELGAGAVPHIRVGGGVGDQRCHKGGMVDGVSPRGTPPPRTTSSFSKTIVGVGI
jgi:hypothetical protein